MLKASVVAASKAGFPSLTIMGLARRDLYVRCSHGELESSILQLF